MAWRVRTTTQRTTSLFFSVPSGAASLTLAVITSPMPAWSDFLPMTPIMVARRAPVLSATSTQERICIMAVLVFEDGDEFPALELAQGAGFTDEDAIAGLGFVLFVVGVELLVHADDLLELGVRNAALDADDDGLLHLRRENFAGAFLAGVLR